MFRRANKRFKDGKEHRYWSIVESRRTHGGRVVQRQVLYLGEINDSQRAAWYRTIKVFEHGQDQPTQVAIFLHDRQALALDCEVVQIRLNEWRLHRHGYEQSAMADLLGENFALVQSDQLYRRLDKLLPHQQGLFSYLRQRWEALFEATFNVLLYDLTNTW